MNTSESFEGLSDVVIGGSNHQEIITKSIDLLHNLMGRINNVDMPKIDPDTIEENISSMESILNILEQISQICDSIFMSMHEMRFIWSNIYPKLKSQSSPEAVIVHYVIKRLDEIIKVVSNYVYRENSQNYMDTFLYRKNEIVGRNRLELSETEKEIVVQKHNQKTMSHIHADLTILRFMLLELHTFIRYNQNEII